MHRVLVGAVAFMLLVFVLLGVTGSLGSALGSYAPTIEEGALLSRGALRSAIVHVDVVAVAIGLVLSCSAAGGRSRRSCTGRRASSCTRSLRSS